jgi:hypothetical protein
MCTMITVNEVKVSGLDVRLTKKTRETCTGNLRVVDHFWLFGKIRTIYQLVWDNGVLVSKNKKEPRKFICRRTAKELAAK